MAITVLEVALAFVLLPGAPVSWLSGYRTIQATITAGYDVGAEPVLTMAIGMIVAHWMALRRSPGVSNASQGSQSATIVPDRGLPNHVQQLLWPYRLVGRER